MTGKEESLHNGYSSVYSYLLQMLCSLYLHLALQLVRVLFLGAVIQTFTPRGSKS